ncbi:MAG: hypothetical protein KZQ58_09245 [gamma proteobacterium symbiont of Bathyaustriella thionipta]|nr:hypothetical protein [gamma proteobacterium symbiont of Bathyaustriella thionipta]
MTTEGLQFRIVFSGEISGDRLHADVVQDLEEWLHIPKEKAESLLQGKRAKLKRTYPRAKAERILEKANMLGAKCSIEPVVNASLALENVELEQTEAEAAATATVSEDADSSMLVSQFNRAPASGAENTQEDFVPPQHFPTLHPSSFNDDSNAAPQADKKSQSCRWVSCFWVEVFCYWLSACCSYYLREAMRTRLVLRHRHQQIRLKPKMPSHKKWPRVRSR